jgi:hypothetical protein
MKIHTDNLGRADILNAADDAGVIVTALYARGSRSRDHAFDVYLSGTSPHRTQRGEGPAATWDEWGKFLAILFKREPTLKAGPYDGLVDFVEKTEAWAGSRRALGQPADAPWLRDESLISCA